MTEIGLHEQLALDVYWDGPGPSEAPELSWRQRMQDAYRKPFVVHVMLGAVSNLCSGEQHRQTVEHGQQLGIAAAAGGIVQAVEDRRIRLSQGAATPDLASPVRHFNNAAVRMPTTFPYRGRGVYTRVETAEGPVLVGRRILHLLTMANGKRLLAMQSNYGPLAREPGVETIEYIPYNLRVGDVRTEKDRSGAVTMERRIVAAVAMTPLNKPGNDGPPDGGHRLRVRRAYLLLDRN